MAIKDVFEKGMTFLKRAKKAPTENTKSSSKIYIQVATAKADRKSSINFQKAHIGGFKHNDRTEDEPSYLLPKKYRQENEFDITAKEAEKRVKELYEETKQAFKKRTGQKLQAKSYLWEAVVNLGEKHTMQDVKKLAEAIEKEFGFTSVQLAIHRDEGHIKGDEVVYNYHAHLSFFTLDRKYGTQLYRKEVKPLQKKLGIKPMNRERLTKLQDMTAEILGMQRGKKGSTTQRLNAKEYRAVAKDKEPMSAELEKLNAENKDLRADLQELGATRKDYAKLETLVKQLRETIKSKDLSIEEQKRQIAELEAKIKAFKKQLEDQKKELETVQKERDKAQKELEELKNAKNAQISQEVTDLRAELAEAKKIAKNATSELAGYKTKIENRELRAVGSDERVVKAEDHRKFKKSHDILKDLEASSEKNKKMLKQMGFGR